MKKQWICLGMMALLSLYMRTSLLINSTYGAASYIPRDIPVLMYHHILDELEISEAQLKVGTIITRQLFESHMNFLEENSYVTITIEELLLHLSGEKEAPLKSVVITFDDGYLSNYVYAYPVLKEKGFVAAQFAITALLPEEAQPFTSETLQRISWEEAFEMKDVFYFYSHTHNMHSSDLLTLPFGKVKTDLRTSLDLLKENDYDKQIAFAYPYGNYNEDTRHLLRKKGIKIAFTTEEGYASYREPLLEQRRFAIFPWTTMNQLKIIVEGNYLHP